MRVIVLGCGPAGLFAVHAARNRGCDVTIYSGGGKSEIGGAQWLRPVPGITDGIEPDVVTFTKVGNEDGYALKAYDEPGATVSWESYLSGDHEAYSLYDAYDQLWDLYCDEVNKRLISYWDIQDLVKEADLVFSSIPADTLCIDEHHLFPSQRVVFTKEPLVMVDNLIIYNGRLSDPWYRASRLFGHCSVEYALDNDHIEVPMHVKNIPHIIGTKPVNTDCNCHAQHTNFARIGRFGRWQRGVLTHHAYLDAYERTQRG